MAGDGQARFMRHLAEPARNLGDPDAVTVAHDHGLAAPEKSSVDEDVERLARGL